MSKTILNGTWIGTKANYKALTNIESSKKYYITDLETFAITNQGMSSAISTYPNFYKSGEVFICTDQGTYLQGHLYKWTNNSWEDITPINQPYGFAGLDSSGKIPNELLPVNLTEISESIGNITAILATLTTPTGD